ncbi:N-acetylmuramoyl-L-alanine amidase [Pontibacter ummariensis]|uniref:N-acetylmuramoyl-L-alanine amidase n=1 Tax=Pontibacter ummariensis TaxID=1610492 RepID=A0A239BD86_9BACT|nr:N-acetylmuramoyl-L-alanine amidase [Pontibacter ummariensis]PRY16475.1 N-acetylmuramoyl-L-alanine amidase [Pontibacter ummariensis]SNS05826.1 N-acetylmuramoyl-L-alanine amidase [Pontibacter ummariensis]
MKRLTASFLLLTGLLAASCSSNPYASTNRVYKKQVKAYARSLKTLPANGKGEETAQPGDYWVGTTNFNMRKPNFVIIHHTAQHSTGQTLKTFTERRTQVSAHYVIGRDGKVYHMLSDYLRAWHGGAGKWGNNTDLNSSSIGIELDNNGNEPFSEAQIASLLKVLAKLKKDHGIPTANFIGHADIAPERKVDPNPTFPWKKLAENGFGLWYDEEALLDSAVASNTAFTPDSTVSTANLTILDSTLVSGVVSPDSLFVPVPVPDPIKPQEALRIIGYDTRNMGAAIRAFKLHFVQSDTSTTLTARDKKILFNLYKKYL